MFAAEQTWPTEEEMLQARNRKLSENEGMQEMDTGELDIGSFDVSKKAKGEGLEELFEKMQIAVVGQEGQASQQSSEEEDSGSDIGEVDEELDYMQEDPNFISQRHDKHTNMENRAQEDMDFPDEVDTP